MTRQFSILIQFTFTIVTSIAALYTDEVHRWQFDLDKYFFFIFLYLAWSQYRQRWIPPHWMIVGYTVELLYSLSLVYTFSSVLVFLLIASWVTAPASWSASQQMKLFTVSWVTLQVSLIEYSWVTMININLMTILIGILLWRLRQFTSMKQELLTLNDQLRQQAYELHQSKLDMIQYTRTVEELSQAEERSRIAHDLHDELGHQFIRLKMMMDASVEVSSVNQEQAFKLFVEVRSQLASCMEMMRSTVQRLKPEDHRLHAYSLERLQREYENDKFRVDYRVEGVPYLLYPSLEIALYRNAREALINAIRHGQASEASITLSYEPNQVVLHVSNNGQVPTVPINMGIGMRGMQDRAQTLGGNVQVKMDSLFCIQTKLPVLSTQSGRTS